MTPAEINALTSVATLILGSLITYALTRLGKAADARVAADAAVMGIVPPIIEQQNKRITQLTEEVERLWERDRECRRELDEANDRILILERKVGP